MKNNKNTNNQVKIQPTNIRGELNIGDLKISVGQNAVKSEPGTSKTNLLSKLKEASKKSIFSLPSPRAYE